MLTVTSTFELDWDLDYPEAALSVIRLLLLSDAEWSKARDKGKPPKPKADAEVLTVLLKAIEERMSEYSTTVAVCFIAYESGVFIDAIVYLGGRCATFNGNLNQSTSSHNSPSG